MKGKTIYLGALFGLLLALSIPVHAAIITSTADSALNGATIIGFESLAVGTYPVMTFPGVSIFNGMSILGTDFSVYGLSGQTLSNLSGVGLGPQTINLAFSTPVSAFGIQAAAIEREIIYTAFDEFGAVLGIVPFQSFQNSAGNCLPCTRFFRGIQADGIAFVKLAMSGDNVIFDDLYFVPQMTPIPEPSTMLLFGTGLAGLGLWRYRKGVKVYGRTSLA